MLAGPNSLLKTTHAGARGANVPQGPGRSDRESGERSPLGVGPGRMGRSTARDGEWKSPSPAISEARDQGLSKPRDPGSTSSCPRPRRWPAIVVGSLCDAGIRNTSDFAGRLEISGENPPPHRSLRWLRHPGRPRSRLRSRISHEPFRRLVGSGPLLAVDIPSLPMLSCPHSGRSRILDTVGEFPSVVFRPDIWAGRRPPVRRMRDFRRP